MRKKIINEKKVRKKYIEIVFGIVEIIFVFNNSTIEIKILVRIFNHTYIHLNRPTHIHTDRKSDIHRRILANF